MTLADGRIREFNELQEDVFSVQADGPAFKVDVLPDSLTFPLAHPKFKLPKPASLSFNRIQRIPVEKANSQGRMPDVCLTAHINPGR